jgi:hypothetical protein
VVTAVVCGLVFVLLGLQAGSAQATPVKRLSDEDVSVLKAAAVSSTGSALIAESFGSGFVKPDSLFSFAPSSPPLTLVSDAVVLSAAVSSNGRFEAWATGACTRIFGRDTQTARVYLNKAGEPASSSATITLPAAYAHIGIDGMSIGPTGRVTALVSTYDDPCLIDQSTGPVNRYHDAIITAAPGATHFQVVAAVHSDPGSSLVSPTGSTFLLCAGRQRLTYVRANSVFEVSHPVSQGTCVLGPSGELYRLNKNGTEPQIVTGVRTIRQAVIKPPGTGLLGQILNPAETDDTFGAGISASGAQELLDYQRTTDNGAFAGTPDLVLFDSRDGKSVLIPLPKKLGKLTIQSGLWTGPRTVLLFPERGGAITPPAKSISLNVDTRTWGPLVDLGQGSRGAVRCVLPSGDVLFADGNPEPSEVTDNTKIRLLNRSGTRIRTIDTSAIGPIHAISCPSGSHNIYVSTGSHPATLYSIQASAINGSPWH